MAGFDSTKRQSGHGSSVSDRRSGCASSYNSSMSLLSLLGHKPNQTLIIKQDNAKVHESLPLQLQAATRRRSKKSPCRIFPTKNSGTPGSSRWDSVPTTVKDSPCSLPPRQRSIRSGNFAVGTPLRLPVRSKSFSKSQQDGPVGLPTLSLFEASQATIDRSRARVKSR
jgi:hypothetical protein